MSNNEDDYIDFQIYKKDIDSAKSEIEELERVLKQAKKAYKKTYKKDYDFKWFHYITQAFYWINPMNYISFFELDLNFDFDNYSAYRKDNFTEGYNMYYNRAKRYEEEMNTYAEINNKLEINSDFETNTDVEDEEESNDGPDELDSSAVNE